MDRRSHIDCFYVFGGAVICHCKTTTYFTPQFGFCGLKFSVIKTSGCKIHNVTLTATSVLNILAVTIQCAFNDTAIKVKVEGNYHRFEKP